MTTKLRQAARQRHERVDAEIHRATRGVDGCCWLTTAGQGRPEELQLAAASSSAQTKSWQDASSLSAMPTWSFDVATPWGVGEMCHQHHCRDATERSRCRLGAAEARCRLLRLNTVGEECRWCLPTRNGKTAIVYYRTLSFFCLSFKKKTKVHFFRVFKDSSLHFNIVQF